MNRILFAILFAGMFVLSGCGEADKSSAVEVTIDGGVRFPAELAGRWKAGGKYGWDIVFEKDGSISSVIHTLGRFKLEPGKETIVPMKEEGQSVLDPGEWKVAYNPAGRVLEVEIVLDYFYCEMGEGHIEGDRRDIFAGPVSKDGKKWEVDWTFFMECTAMIGEEPTDLSTDPEYGEKRKLIFKKED